MSQKLIQHSILEIPLENVLFMDEMPSQFRQKNIHFIEMTDRKNILLT